MSGVIKGYTAHLNMAIPKFDVPFWHVYYEQNLNVIDSVIFLLTGISYVRGVWQISTSYLVGDFVIDPDTAISYKCKIEHVSAVSGSFEDERTAHPTYWEAQDISLTTSDNTWSGLNVFSNDVTFNDTVTFAIAPVGLLANIVDDTTPQLGGDLDRNGHQITGLVIGTDILAYDAQLTSNIRKNEQSANYAAVLTDAQKFIYHPSTDNNARTFTIPANASVAYPIGTTLTFVNKINILSIAINDDTLIFLNSTGTRALAAGGMATALKTDTTEWVISGSGLS